MPGPGARMLLAALLATVAWAAVGRTATVRDNLYDVKSLGPTEAWAVGNFGAIVHTTDGGKSWEPSDSGTKSPLFGVDFVGSDGWAVGRAALILHTADGGKSWRPQASGIPPHKPLFKVYAVDAKTVWAIGDWGAVARTRNGGETWEDRSLPDDVVLYDLSFPDRQHGFIAGEAGTLLATDDGGDSWHALAVGTDKTLFGVCFSTPETGWVVGIDGIILHTRDGGRSWKVQRGAMGAGSIEELGFAEALANPGLYAVRVVGDYGVVAGDTGMLLVTTDGGETWTEEQLPGKDRLVWMSGASLIAGREGFIVGASGFSARVERDRVVVADAGRR
jgi:photosystem II stability/assembly factor-like uncharacterized protein